jgi:hypothetical protein
LWLEAKLDGIHSHKFRRRGLLLMEYFQKYAI